MESRADTVWNVLNESDSPEDAASDVAKQVTSFVTHLINVLPDLEQRIHDWRASWSPRSSIRRKPSAPVAIAKPCAKLHSQVVTLV